ncbi:MAG TPA: hypothetical protein VEW72_05320, partial [Burkholderiales bacterium]|nr:hypothetical protein [Burkholderiales bacterium]
MDKKTPQQQPIDNAADYVDSLLRPQPDDHSMKWKFIEGRRMRDKMIGQVIVPDEAVNQVPG